MAGGRTSTSLRVSLYLRPEIRFGVREYACTAVDVIARRLRLAFLNTQAAEEALPKIVEVMGEELKWSTKEKEAGTEKSDGIPSERNGTTGQQRNERFVANFSDKG